MLFQVSTICSCNFCCVFMCAIYYYVQLQIALLKQVASLSVTLHVTQVVANKIIIITFSLVSVKYGINFTIARNRYYYYDKYTPHNLQNTHVSLAYVL